MVQVTLSRQRQPIVQEYFKRPPIRDPAQNEKAFLSQTPERRINQIAAREMCRDEAYDQNSDSDPKRPSTYPKKLLDLSLSSTGAFGKIAMECLAQVLSRIRPSLGFRIMDHDPYRPIGRQFAGPPDDELFRFLIEIAFPKRKWVQGME